ncbi:cytochrome P450 [Mesorhizobium sp. M0815]|uniref:FitA-like ribbon-helix-helix domain-containing protein n=1 Tax=Mesorhizobium sp. M0815 TaxID=2957005 RepID=UPI0033350B0E
MAVLTVRNLPDDVHRALRVRAAQHGHSDDLASALIVARDNGELVSDTELIDILFMVLTAGFVTTTAVIRNGVLALLTHPQQMHLVRSGQVPWSQAIEEILRWGSTVANLPFRYATQDVEIDGCTGPPRRRRPDGVPCGEPGRKGLRSRPRQVRYHEPAPVVRPGAAFLPGRCAGGPAIELRLPRAIRAAGGSGGDHRRGGRRLHGFLRHLLPPRLPVAFRPSIA